MDAKSKRNNPTFSTLTGNFLLKSFERDSLCCLRAQTTCKSHLHFKRNNLLFCEQNQWIAIDKNGTFNK